MALGPYGWSDAPSRPAGSSLKGSGHFETQGRFSARARCLDKCRAAWGRREPVSSREVSRSACAGEAEEALTHWTAV